MTFHNAEQSDFRQVSITNLEFEIQAGYDSTDDYLELFEPFFIESPNQDKHIDIDSYGLLLKEENGELVSYGSSPDTEILLVDLNTNKQKRLAFYGTAVIVEDAHWVSSNVIRIFQIDVGEFDFRLEFMDYNLIQGTKTLWTSDRTFSTYSNSYNEQIRLSSVNFK